MTNFLKSSEPMPPRLGMVVGVSIIGGIEILRLVIRSAMVYSYTKIAYPYAALLRNVYIPTTAMLPPLHP